MTFDRTGVAAEEARRAALAATGLCRAGDGHASCGVGLVVAINGKPSRRVAAA